MFRTLLATCAVALTLAAPALASGGHYTVDGGTEFEQAQVRLALDVSKFDFDQVPDLIRIHIQPGETTESLPGDIWVGADWFKLTPTTWGFIQHEYAHQLDFFVLTAAQRAEAATLLGASRWDFDGELAHEDYGAERFASLLAYTFWPERTSAESPELDADTRAALANTTIRAFQSMLARWGYAVAPAPVCRQVLAKRGHRVWVRVHGLRLHRWVKPIYGKACST
jgi:hypothetical protein